MISTHTNCGLAPTQTTAIPPPKLLIAPRQDYRNHISMSNYPEIVVVNDGEQVLAALSSIKPLAVILDTDLTRQSGWLVGAKIQFIRLHPRVVLLSSTISDKVIAFANFVGADELRLRPQNGEQFRRLASETIASCM